MNSVRIAAMFLFLTAFGIYLHGAYPSVSAGDSGEFITAAYSLGIPHAPGFPTYVVLAKTFQTLVPLGNIGYRTNLFSATCGAATVLVLFLLGLRLAFSPFVAGGAALLFMCSTAHRVNAQASEVFALHVLFCAVVLWAALSDRWLLSAFLAGVGLGNHQTLLFIGPALAGVCFLKPTPERPPVSGLMACLFAGLSIYLFLFFRAADTPVMNLGNPSSLERLWRVITRADYGTLTLALGDTPERNLAMTYQQLARFFQGLNHEVTWAGLLAGILGLIMGIRQRSIGAYLLFSAFLLVGPVFFLLGNLPFDAQSNGLLERFYIVPAFCWILLAALGIQFVFQKERRLGVAFLLVPLALSAPQGLAQAISFRQDVRAYAYGRNNLRTLPPQSLLIMDGGDDTFYTLSYLRVVEKRRPDVTLHDRGGVVFPGFYGADFRALTREGKEARRQQVERAALSDTRPVYFSTMNDRLLPGVPLLQEGILYSALRRRDTTMWDLYDLRGIAPWHTPSTFYLSDYRTRALVPFYAYQRSVQAGRERQWNDAFHFSHTAFTSGRDVLWLLPNLRFNGYTWTQTLFQSNQMVEAEHLGRLVTIWDPQSAIAWANLGVVEERRGQIDAAIQNYQKAIEIDPVSETTLYNLSVAYWKKSDWLKVIETLNRVLAINPHHGAAQNYLNQARARIGRS